MYKNGVKILFVHSNIIFYLSMCIMVYMNYTNYNGYLWIGILFAMGLSLIISLLTDVYINLGYNINYKLNRKSNIIKIIILVLFFGIWSYLKDKQQNIILIVSIFMMLIDCYFLKNIYKELSDINIKEVINKIKQIDLKDKKKLYNLCLKNFIVSSLYIGLCENILIENLIFGLIFLIFQHKIIRNISFELKQIYYDDINKVSKVMILIYIGILSIFILQLFEVKKFFSIIIIGFNFMILSDSIYPKKTSIKVIKNDINK